MLLVNAMVFVGIFMVVSAMTNLLVGVATIALLIVVGWTSGLANGYLAALIFGTLVYANLPWEAEEHGHGHGAPAKDAPGFWDPWGIAYRLITGVVVCLAISGFTAGVSDPSAKLLGFERASLIADVWMGIRCGAGLLALLTVFQVATNWSSALPQGPGAIMPATPAAPAPGGDHAAH